jgi:hypothetical protein
MRCPFQSIFAHAKSCIAPHFRARILMRLERKPLDVGLLRESCQTLLDLLHTVEELVPVVHDNNGATLLG